MVIIFIYIDLIYLLLLNVILNWFFEFCKGVYFFYKFLILREYIMVNYIYVYLYLWNGDYIIEI